MINEFKNDYVVFDLETTGFSAKNNDIIEISAIKCINNNIDSTFSYLVNPKTNIPYTITKLTGISNNDVKGAKTIEQVLPEFITFIGDYPLVAHNGRFDLSFIKENLEKLNIPMIQNENIDTVTLAREYLKDLPNHKLETLKEFLNIDNISHRALQDCMTTNEVYKYCKEQALK